MRKLVVSLFFLALVGCQSTEKKQERNETPLKQTNKSLTFKLPDSQMIESDVFDTVGIPQEQENLWDRLSMQFYLPIPHDNARVAYYKKWFLDHPRHLRILAERARPYLYMVTEQLEQNDMPLEIALLPAIESTYKTTARSRHGAAGMWQFIPATGKRFGLKISSWYDGRRDPVASTKTAMVFFHYLKEEFDGNWIHAIAAYNSGEGWVSRAIKNNKKQGKATDFWSLRLPRETSNYVPKLLALVDIVKNHKAYNIKLPMIANKQAVAEINPKVQIDLSIAAKLAKIPAREMFNLNAGYRQAVTMPHSKQTLLLPIDKVQTFETNLSKVKGKKRLVVTYKVKKGDNLGAIARRYKTTVSALQTVNQLKSTMIRIGQTLKLPAYFSKRS